MREPKNVISFKVGGITAIFFFVLIIVFSLIV